MITKARRRQRIKDLLAHNQVTSQERLQAMLGRAGVAVNQATLSRDLRDMGVLKGSAGYRLPDGPAPALNGVGELKRLLSAQLISIESGENLIVLRTMPGHANPLAIEIDKSQIPGVMGTIAGDDTVFVAAKSTDQAGRALKHLRALAERK